MRCVASALTVCACATPPVSTGADPTWPEGVSATAPAACEAPLDEPAWVEVGADWGLPAGPDPDADHDSGGGLVVHDLDDDGSVDLVLSWEDHDPVVVWAPAEGGVIEPVPVPGNGTQPSLSDVDGDGYLDVQFGSESATLGALMGGPERVEGVVLSTVPRGAMVRELAPGDLDGDGRDEYFAALIGDPAVPEDIADRLYRAGSAGLVADPPLEAATAGRLAFDALWFDADSDADLDVYVVNDRGPEHGGNVLWRNDAGELVDASAGSGADLAFSGMGADAADLDGDSLDDLLVVGTDAAYLLLAQGDGTFADASAAWGFSLADGPETMAWGVVALDADNDGDQDVLVAHGDQWGAGIGEGVQRPLPLELYEQIDQRLRPIGARVGLARSGSWRGVVATHLDGDGLLDIVASDVVGRPHVYQSTGCTAAGWLTVRAPSGSRVVVEAGGHTWADTARSGSSYGAASTPEVHVGLGVEQTIDRVTVVAPGGAPVVIPGPFAARRQLTVRRP